jgi:myo-inositol-1(or 4)-monophosphatase
MAQLEDLYQRLTDFIVVSGRRVHKRTGNIKDIGVLKVNLTEEDLRIERELTAMIVEVFPSHVVFAEEEHGVFKQSADIWAIDPISGTAAFIAGLPHYGLVITHLVHGKPQFSAVYDPSIDELFTARAGHGATLNNQPIHVSDGTKKVLFNLASTVDKSPTAASLWQTVLELKAYRNANSFAVNYCWIAAGRYDGIVALTKDAFPEYAGWLIITEAGGLFTTAKGGSVEPDDRLFVGGNQAMYQYLRDQVAWLA